MTGTAAVTRGLEGVVAASTALSTIDGAAGRLRYAGYDIHELADHATYEEVCYLLWHGDLPAPAELAAFTEQLAAARTLTADELALVAATPRRGHGMDALRTMVSALAQLDPRADDTSLAGATRIGLQVTAKLPALIAAWDRARRGLAPLSPDPALGHAANILFMLHGTPPTDAEARALDSYMVLLAEHGLNASTFAARVAISAGADVYAALVAAIATLKGVLHGGANQRAMEMLLEIGEPAHAAGYVNDVLARRGRLMGIGHRIYRVEDPRVRHLRARLAGLPGSVGGMALADAVRQVVAQHPYFAERQLAPNVEFASAPLLYALGFPLDLFTCAFAASRIAGWVGHIREQIADNRIIRPKADYHGPTDRPFVPLASRKARRAVV